MSTLASAQPKTSSPWVIRPSLRSANRSAATCARTGAGRTSRVSSVPSRTRRPSRSIEPMTRSARPNAVPAAPYRKAISPQRVAAERVDVREHQQDRDEVEGGRREVGRPWSARTRCGTSSWSGSTSRRSCRRPAARRRPAAGTTGPSPAPSATLDHHPARRDGLQRRARRASSASAQPAWKAYAPASPQPVCLPRKTSAGTWSSDDQGSARATSPSAPGKRFSGSSIPEKNMPASQQIWSTPAPSISQNAESATR